MWVSCVDVAQDLASGGSGGGFRALMSRKTWLREGLEVGLAR